MSISLHQNGKTHADLKHGLQDHIFRENEVDAERVSKYTNSYINPNETKYNKTLYVDESEVSFDEKGKINFTQNLRDEFQEMNEKRKSEGLRAKQKNAFVASVDTLQLSDEALEAMGYQKFYDDRFDVDEQGREIAVRKPWSEQTEEARRLVIQAYSAMIEATNDRPDLYGRTVVARLHVDESTPHVERVARMVDKNDYEFNASNIINGNHLGKGMRGKKYAEKRQDHFAEKTREILGEEFSNRYCIKRGEKGSAKTDKLKNLSLYEQAIEIKAKKFAEQQHALEMQRLALIQREGAFEQREDALRGFASRLEEISDDLDRREKNVRESENRASERLDEVKNVTDKYHNDINRWYNNGLRFAEAINEKIAELDAKTDEALSKSDRKYLDIAMKVCTIKMKSGKIIPFSQYVENDKAREKQLLKNEMSNATDLYSNNVPSKPKAKDFGLDY